MPRLVGAADFNTFNFFDAIRFSEPSDREDLLRGYARLYRNRNIGDRKYCNLQVGGQLACDQTAYVQNVYARTNLLLFRSSFHEWAHKAIATIIVGERQLRDASVFDLLRGEPMRPEGKPFACPHCGEIVELEAMKSAFATPADGGEPSPTARKVITVMVRQWFEIRLQVDIGATTRLLEELDKRAPDEPIALWIHTEGLAARAIY